MKEIEVKFGCTIFQNVHGHKLKINRLVGKTCIKKLSNSHRASTPGLQ
jgi:hypothetical protein